MNLAEISEAVLAFCVQDGLLLTDDLTQVEEVLLAAVRRIGAKAVEVHLRRGKLAYDRVRAAGLDIGSGQVEAECKHVVAARMKRCGMRWSKAGSQNTLSLRVAWLNADWNPVWADHPLTRAA